MDHDEYIRRIRSYIKTPTKDMEQQLEEFCSLCTYISGQYDRDDSFQALNAHLEELEKGHTETHRLFYMALPPSVFTIVSQHLKRCCYPTKGIARVIVRIPWAVGARCLHACIGADRTPVPIRSRNRSARILLARASCRSRWSRTGPRTSCIALIITWARRW